MKPILILGGYGNFGSVIARLLAKEKDVRLIIAGRSAEKAQNLAAELGADWAAFDIHADLDAQLERLRPAVVIHTSGPFQGQGYDVAQACIRHKCHYIDLADGRDFVANIGTLGAAAKDAGVLVVSGASSVPCLTAAIIDQYQPQFKTIETIDYGIATAQRTNPGVATTAAILGYAGKPFTTKIGGAMQRVFGWQGLIARRYPELGWRLLGNCDVPDLALFPARYPEIQTIRFRAGLEVPLLHLGLWALSWTVRAGIVKTLRPLAPALCKAGDWFDAFGTDRSAFHMEMRGIGHDGRIKTVTFYILTASGHGLNIPCVPAVLLALRLARGEIAQHGATPCLGLITLDEYLAVLARFDIRWSAAP